ncbi:hypothetical protein D1Y84_17325 [Acidipila sp. EB88]|nr:hypothetical protein D1Y84_17325 [Acidipila sp. EB88]
MLLLLGISGLWGSSWIIAPTASSLAPPFALAAMLHLEAAAWLLCASIFMRKTMRASGPPITSSGRVPVARSLLLAVLLFAAPAALLIVAGEHGASGWAPLCAATMPLMLALADGLAAGSLILPLSAAVGATLVLLNGSVPFAWNKAAWALLSLLAVATQASGLRMAAVQLRGDLGPHPLRSLVRSLALQCAVAAVLLGSVSFVVEPAPRLAAPHVWAGSELSAMLLLSTLGIAVPYAALLWLLTRSPLCTHQVVVTQWIQFLVAAMEAMVLSQAEPSTTWLAAAVALAVCVLLVLWQPGTAPGNSALTNLLESPFA